MDIVHFCTSTDEFCIASIDPTFNLGDFDITPLNYRRLLLETEHSGNRPVFLGPILIHFCKNFSTILYVASRLVGLQCDLEKLKAFGIDGEVALVDAFSRQFGFATHLSCTLHLRYNMKQCLQEMNFPE